MRLAGIAGFAQFGPYSAATEDELVAGMKPLSARESDLIALTADEASQEISRRYRALCDGLLDVVGIESRGYAGNLGVTMALAASGRAAAETEIRLAHRAGAELTHARAVKLLRYEGF